MKERRLLIVEDDEDARNNLADILTDLGYRTDTACDGECALDLLAGHELALLDFKLPGMTGVEAFVRMREIYDNIQGILVTACAANETAQAALAAGIRHIVNKPLDISHLLPLIEDLLG